MVGIAVVTRAALLIARRASTWTIEEHLGGRSPECVAVDLHGPTQVYCGTASAGLFRSRDSGQNWEPVGPGHRPPDAHRGCCGSRATSWGVRYRLCRHRTKCGVSLRHGRRQLGGPRRIARAPFGRHLEFSPTAPYTSCPVDRSRCEGRGSRFRRHRGWSARAHVRRRPDLA